MAEEGFPEVAATDFINPDQSGFLNKKRPSKKFMSIKYQRRWCVIQHHVFYYFDGQLDRKQKGAFSLKGYRFFHLQDSERSFALVGKGKRSFEFIAPTREAFQQWEKAVSRSAAGFQDISSKFLERSTSLPINRSFEDLYSAEHYMAEKYKKESVRKLPIGRTPPRPPPPIPSASSTPMKDDQDIHSGLELHKEEPAYATLPPNFHFRSHEPDAGDDDESSDESDDYEKVPDIPPRLSMEIAHQELRVHGYDVDDVSGGYEILPIRPPRHSRGSFHHYDIEDKHYDFVDNDLIESNMEDETDELYIQNLPNQKIPQTPRNGPFGRLNKCKLDEATLADDTYIEFCVEDGSTTAKKEAPSSSISALLGRRKQSNFDDSVDDIYIDLQEEGTNLETETCSEVYSHVIKQKTKNIEHVGPNSSKSSNVKKTSFVTEPIYENLRNITSIKQKSLVSLHSDLHMKFKKSKQASYDEPELDEQSSDSSDEGIDYENAPAKLK